jgi:perosamine synthetase
MIPHSKPWITESDQEAVNAMLTSGQIALGKLVRRFEEAVAAYFGAAGGIAVGSGTAALVLALRTLEIGTGDEVILPTYVCHEVADAVRAVGAVPILCDVGAEWNMTAETVRPHLTSRTRAIIGVHIFGIAADMDSLLAFGLPVIEDCCQAFGAPGTGRGTINIHSFHATKCLTTGAGGMVTSADPVWMDRLRQFQQYHQSLSPLTDVQAALGISQLERYPAMLERRQAIAERYFAAFPPDWTAKLAGARQHSMFYRFPTTAGFSAAHVQAFEERGVLVRRGVDTLLHRRDNLPDDAFPNAAAHFEATLSVPLYPALTDAEVQTVIEAVQAVAAGEGIHP